MTSRDQVLPAPHEVALNWSAARQRLFYRFNLRLIDWFQSKPIGIPLAFAYLFNGSFYSGVQIARLKHKMFEQRMLRSLQMRRQIRQIGHVRLPRVERSAA
jgi:hypothetical protein